MLLGLFTLGSLSSAAPYDGYSAGKQGETCTDHCAALGKVCLPSVVTGNTSAVFAAVGLACTDDADPWWAPDQPSMSVDPADPNYGKCLGFVGVPAVTPCDGAEHAVRRVCHCGGPIPPTPAPTPVPPSAAPFFGTGYSGGKLSAAEYELFTHTVDAGHYGVMTHFWMTAMAGVADGTIVRYYIDGEASASIAFRPPLACGSALDAEASAAAPWGTKWFGKGAKDGAWFHNFRVPFQSIRITLASDRGPANGVYFIVRGARDLPISIGGVPVPVAERGARMQLQVTETRNTPALDFVTVADAPTNTSGLLFMSTLAVESANLNFLEGCFHAYTPHDQVFPGTLISTGTEDYYDSAWYFNAGPFRMPVSGLTKLDKDGSGAISWSAYRFHEMDPLMFSDGFRFVWRNGDLLDPTGLKCFTESGGTVAGNPQPSNVTSYAWMYVWN